MIELFFVLLAVLALILVALAAVSVIIGYASQIAYIDPLNESEEENVDKNS